MNIIDMHKKETSSKAMLSNRNIKVTSLDTKDHQSFVKVRKSDPNIYESSIRIKQREF